MQDCVQGRGLGRFCTFLFFITSISAFPPLKMTNNYGAGSKYNGNCSTFSLTSLQVFGLNCGAFKAIGNNNCFTPFRTPITLRHFRVACFTKMALSIFCRAYWMMNIFKLHGLQFLVPLNLQLLSDSVNCT